MNIRDGREFRTLSVCFLEATDAGREVRFAVLDPSSTVRLSEIVASSTALGTYKYDISGLSAQLAEGALGALDYFEHVPRMLEEHARHEHTTPLQVLSRFYVKITSTLMTLEEKKESP